MLLHIESLELWTHIGVPVEEHEKEQRILVTVELEIEEETHQSDVLADSVDYDVIVRTIKRCTAGERKTLEKFGGEIIEALRMFDRIRNITVHLTKFILPGTEGITVSLSCP